jgi:hypothetical protein
VQNIALLDKRDAKVCLFEQTWCKRLPLLINVVQNIAPLRKVVQNCYAGEITLHDEQLAVITAGQIVQTAAKYYVVKGI